MTRNPLIALAGALVLVGCAHLQPERQSNVAGNGYLACLNAAAESNMGNPAGADEIAGAAHARCWSEWSRYQEAIKTDYVRRATTAEEAQLAHDKADAHLRQFELEARRAVVSRVVQRNYGVK